MSDGEESAPRGAPTAAEMDIGQAGQGAAASKKRKKKQGRGAKSLLDDATWRSVPMGDNLLGGDEGGLMGLEVLDDPAVMAALYPETYGAKGTSDKAQAPAKKKAKNEVEASGQGGGPEEEELKAKLARLEKENRRLKASSKKQKQQEKRMKRLEEQRIKKEKKGQEEAPAEGEEAEEDSEDGGAKEEPGVDTSAWSEFGLHGRVGRAISKLGFSGPTPVQAECLLPAIRDRRDIIGAAQTGSGKTLAFGLPIMQRLTAEMENSTSACGDGSRFTPGPLRALILAPTRELAMQVCKHLKAVGETCGVGVVPIVGGIAAAKQTRLLKKGPAVVVATPGRLWDLLKSGETHLLDMTRLSFLVIDEADRMMQHGQYTELTSLLEQVQASSSNHKADVDEQDVPMVKELQDSLKAGNELKPPPKPAQLFIFSATLTLPQDLRRRLKKGGGGAGGNSATLEGLMDKLKFRDKPKVVDLTGESRVAEKIQEAYIETTDEERDEVLYYLLAAHPGRTIVFANAISAIRRLAAILKLLGLPSAALHAGMQQRARLKALDRFTTGEVTVLVASDVAARGLDVKGVRCVIHYQLPASVDIYVHRSGRTARADEDGLAVSLVVPKDRSRFIALQRALARDPPPEFPLDVRLMPGARDRVKLAVKLDALERRHKKAKTDIDWAVKNAAELEIDLDTDDDLGEDDQGPERGRKKKKKTGKKPGSAGIKGLLSEEEAATASGLKRELARLLSQPLVPKFNARFFTGRNENATTGEQAAGGAASAGQRAQGRAPGGAPEGVQLATRAVQRQADAAAANKSKKVDKPAAKKKPKSTAEIRAAAIQKALQARSSKKRGRMGAKGMVVIPSVAGRDTSRPEAITALRRHLNK